MEESPNFCPTEVGFRVEGFEVFRSLAFGNANVFACSGRIAVPCPHLCEIALECSAASGTAHRCLSVSGRLKTNWPSQYAAGAGRWHSS